MRTLSTVKTLGELLTSIRNKTLIPDPEFQRKLVWTSKDKKTFLETVLKGFPFPEIYIAAGELNLETGEAIQWLVDGQQRMTTLYQYFTAHPELRVGKDIKAYTDLSKQEKSEFLQYEVVVRSLGEMNIAEIKDIFKRINATSYSLNAIERHNSQFNGEFMMFAKDIAKNPFFEDHRVFSANDIRRMQDVTYVLTLIITIMSTYFTREDQLEKYLENFNDDFDKKDQILQEINTVINFVVSCNFEDRSRVWKKNDLFTLLVELHRALFKNNQILDIESVKSRLTDFYNQVNSYASKDELGTTVRSEVGEYYKATLQGTNDRSSRIKRGDIIGELLIQTRP